MKALTYTSFLGIACLVLEIFNLRKVAVPFVLLSLAVIFGLNATEWNSHQSFYHDMLRSDNFALAFTGLLIVITFLLVCMSSNFFRSEESKLADYISIILFTLSGAIAMVSFANLAMFFIGLEILSISLYVLAGSKKKDIRSNEAAMKYFLMGSFASGILLFGIALVYGASGSFNLSEIAAYAASGHVDAIFQVGVVMILIAMLFKVSAAPFHFWAPDVYDGSPTLITVMMATLAKVAALAAFYRLFSVCFTGSFPVFAWVLSIVAALTMVIGNLTALGQDSFKRMLAFSGISHAGYMLLAIITLYNNTPNSLFFYATAYSFASIGAFAIAIIVMRNMKSEKIEAFNGLGKKSPLLAFTLTVLMLSMAGIPPMAGFFGKYYVFLDAIRNQHLGLVIVAVVTSAISVYYYFKVILAMWTQDSDGEAFSADFPYTFVSVVCLVASLVLGVFPSLIASLL
jgi:NADH-quinone oxidoreductase subunit N